MQARPVGDVTVAGLRLTAQEWRDLDEIAQMQLLGLLADARAVATDEAYESYELTVGD